MDRIDPAITYFLRDIYRLSQHDPEGAIRWFSSLIHDGHKHEAHRKVLLEVDAHLKQAKGCATSTP